MTYPSLLLLFWTFYLRFHLYSFIFQVSFYYKIFKKFLKNCFFKILVEWSFIEVMLIFCNAKNLNYIDSFVAIIIVLGKKVGSPRIFCILWDCILKYFLIWSMSVLFITHSIVFKLHKQKFHVHYLCTFQLSTWVAIENLIFWIDMYHIGLTRLMAVLLVFILSDEGRTYAKADSCK